MVNNDSYCNYKLSLKLMRKGFKGICHSVYLDNGKSYRKSLNNFTVKNISDDECLRPTIDEARHWLKEEKHIGVYVYEVDIDKFKVYIAKKQNNKFFPSELELLFDDEISAYEYAINHVLENYIKDKSVESAAEDYMLTLFDKKSQENHEFDEGNSWHEGYLTSIKDCVKNAFLAGVDYQKKELEKI